MSTNITYPGPIVSVRLYTNADYESGDVVTIAPGNGDANCASIAGIAENDEDADGYTVVRLPFTLVAKISVKAIAAAADSAVAVGDLIANDSGEYNKDTTNGVLFGVALGTVAAGETSDINVAVIPFTALGS